jgi:hypothetical protein
MELYREYESEVNEINRLQKGTILYMKNRTN